MNLMKQQYDGLITSFNHIKEVRKMHMAMPDTPLQRWMIQCIDAEAKSVQMMLHNHALCTEYFMTFKEILDDEVFNSRVNSL